MTVSTEQLLAILVGLGGVISTLAGVVYRTLTAQLAECKAENLTLRTEAKETVKAKDAELAELRRIALKPDAR